MSLLCPLLLTVNRCTLSQVLALLENSHWSVWAFDLPLDAMKYQKFWTKEQRIPVCVQHSYKWQIFERETKMMGFETAISFSMNGLGPFSFSLKAVYFAHGICWSFHLFVPFSSANCKKQKQSPWHHPTAAVGWCFYLVKYLVSTWCYFQKGTGWRHALE